MVRRNPNGHELKKQAHPHRVEVRAPADGWRKRDAPLRVAAERLSAGDWYTWSPSRRDPPVTVFGFATQDARDAFAAWLREEGARHLALAAAPADAPDAPRASQPDHIPAARS